MSTGTRLRAGTVYGTLSDALLTNSSGATTMNSAGLATAFTPAVTAPQYMPVILDPQQQNGAPEIVWVTAHTGSATTATVLRAQEGSTLRAHLTGEFWVAGPTLQDYFPWNWTTYTPTWSFGTAPGSIGNGSLTGSYLLFGTTCFITINLTFGSTTSGGEGPWAFSLPSGITASSAQAIPLYAETTGGGGTLWSGLGVLDNSPPTIIPILPVIGTSSNMLPAQNTDASGATGHGIPNTGNNYPFENGSFITITGSFQTA